MAIFDEPSRQPLPSPDFGDVSRAAGRGLLGMVPFGNVASELWAVLGPPVARRRDDWLTDLERRLHELEHTASGFRFEDLGKNEQVVSAILQATQAALKTHRTEKLEALRNAVLNIAIGRSPGEDEQASFIGYIDELSTWHLQMLVFLRNPLTLVRERNGRTDYPIVGSLSQALEEVFPELRGNREFYDQIMRDLRTRGFLNSDETVLHTMMTSSGIFAKRTTGIADRFLNFIKSPELEKP